MPWRPGQQPDRELEAPYEDLPEHLQVHVITWMQRQLGGSGQLTRTVALTRRVPIPDVTSNHGTAVARLMRDANTDQGAALDLLETILEAGMVHPASIGKLDELLRDGHSAYCVNDDLNGLAMRNLPEVKEQVQAVVDAAEGSPGAHLAAAYNAAYGRTPDVERAYDRAIKAVEAAMRPIISPNDTMATLTKMISALRDASQKWTFAVNDERPNPPANAPTADGVQVVLDMMRLLAYGQKQRHADATTVDLNTEDQARAAVMVAVTLVQFAVGGAFSAV